MDSKKHILVVDDELSMREFLQIFLERKQYRVSTAESAEEALAVFEEHEFDLVLSDLNLPGMNGIDFTKTLKQLAGAEKKVVPVILITAFGTATSAVEAMKQGASDYVLKPFDNDELLRIIERVLGEVELREWPPTPPHNQRGLPQSPTLPPLRSRRYRACDAFRLHKPAPGSLWYSSKPPCTLSHCRMTSPA